MLPTSSDKVGGKNLTCRKQGALVKARSVANDGPGWVAHDTGHLPRLR
jgi:hypothetical protein